jgi:hypothetical protein
MVGILLAWNDTGLKIRLALSRPSLEQYIATIPPKASGSFSSWNRVGLFWVDRIREDNGTMLLYTSAMGLMNRTGLAYIPPGGQMPPGKWIAVQPLSGNWYRFEDKF